MKTKPILITILSAAIVIIVVLFFWYRQSNKTDKIEVYAFLKKFNEKLKEGNVDSLKTFFDKDNQIENLDYFVKVLAGIGTNGKVDSLFKVELKMDNVKVTFLNSTFCVANVKVRFSKDALPTKVTRISFTIKKRVKMNSNFIQ